MIETIPIKIASTNGRVLDTIKFPSIPPIGSILKLLDKDKITVVEVEKHEYLLKPLGVTSIKIIVREINEIANNQDRSLVSAGSFIEFKLYEEYYFGSVFQFPEYNYLVCVGFKLKEPLPQFFFVNTIPVDDLHVITRSRYYELLLEHTMQVREIPVTVSEGKVVKLLSFSTSVHDSCPLTNKPISKSRCKACRFSDSIEDESHRMRFKVYCSGGE